MMWTEATNKQEDGGELCDAQRFRSNKIGMWIALSLSCSLSVIVPVTGPTFSAASGCKRT